MHVSEVMTRHVEVIDSNAPLKEAAGKMKILDVGLIPVCDGDKLRGTITDRDITVRGVAEGYDPSKTKSAIASTKSGKVPGRYRIFGRSCRAHRAKSATRRDPGRSFSAGFPQTIRFQQSFGSIRETTEHP